MNISQQLTRDDYAAGAHAAGHLLAESMVLTLTGDAALQRRPTVSRSPLIEAFADITVLLYDVGHHAGAEVPSDLDLDALVTGALATNCPVDPCRQLGHALLAHEPTREALATVAAQHWAVLLPVINANAWMAAQTR